MECSPYTALSVVQDSPPTVNTKWGKSSVSVMVVLSTIKTLDKLRLSLLSIILVIDLSTIMIECIIICLVLKELYVFGLFCEQTDVYSIEAEQKWT